MTYAFHTPDKLCFILDLMNGGDLHYHLSQHGVFNESEMKFYAAEVSFSSEHIGNRMPIVQISIFHIITYSVIKCLHNFAKVKIKIEITTTQLILLFWSSIEDSFKIEFQLI